jgi:hypothetical protein
MNAQSSFCGGLESVAAHWLLAGRIRGRSWFVSLCVPKTSSMSCDLGILVNDAAKTIMSADLKFI